LISRISEGSGAGDGTGYDRIATEGEGEDRFEMRERGDTGGER